MKRISGSFVVPVCKVVEDGIANAQTTQENEVTSSQGNQSKTSENSGGNQEKAMDISKRSTVNKAEKGKIDGMKRKRKDGKVVKAGLQKIAGSEKIKNGEPKPPSNSNETVQSASLGESKSLEVKQIVTKMKLSQPPKIFSHKDRLLWLQKRRKVGVWVQCSRKDCNKWRYLADVHDPINVPKDWFCGNNPDINFNGCSIAEVGPTITEEEDLVYGNYTAGSIVWAKLLGYPWWPAMVDDCPDVEQYYWLDFSDIPTHYNVVFFDSHSATRAWIAPEYLKSYTSTRPLEDTPKKYLKRLAVAKQKADVAVQYEIAKRLEKFSFLAQYEGNIVTPPKVRQTKAAVKMQVRQRTPSPSVSISSDSVEMVLSRGESLSSTKEKASEKLWDKVGFQGFLADVENSVIANKNASHKSFKTAACQTILADVDDSVITNENASCKSSNAVASQTILEDKGESATFIEMTPVEPLTESCSLHGHLTKPAVKSQEQNAATFGFNTMTTETQCSEAWDAIVPTTQTDLETHDFNQFSQNSDVSVDYEFEHFN